MGDSIVISDSSEDDEDAYLPTKEECEKRCQEFSKVTLTDSAFAMMCLQSVKWDLQEAIEVYFSQQSTGDSLVSAKKQKLDDGTDSFHQRLPLIPPQSSVLSEPHRVRVLSWNIDGLDSNQLNARTQSVCDIILRDQPHLIYLQEVTAISQSIIESRLSSVYNFISAGTSEYFVAILSHSRNVSVLQHEIIPFPQSLMCRNLLSVTCSIKNVKIHALTSHLESTKDHKEERLSQLKIAFNKVKGTSPEFDVVFAGDLNLRDTELVEIQGLPSSIVDVWEATGSRPIARYTWDMKRNTNLQFAGRFKPQCRFDRMYLRRSLNKKYYLKPVYFELVGLEKVKHSQRFPSDHWGILAHFDIDTS